MQWHHVTPKSRGGRVTAPVHPICHRTIHACFTNAELERSIETGTPLTANPAVERFVAWIANKDPDFNAPTRRTNEASGEKRVARRRSDKSAG